MRTIPSGAFLICLVGCGGSGATSPAITLSDVVGTYTLESVNNQPLPALDGFYIYGLNGTDTLYRYYAVSGAMTLNPDLTFVETRRTASIWAGLPSGGVSDTLPSSLSGTFSFAGTRLTLVVGGTPPTTLQGIVGKSSVSYSTSVGTMKEFPNGNTFQFGK